MRQMDMRFGKNAQGVLCVLALCLLVMTSCKHKQEQVSREPVQVDVMLIDTTSGDVMRTYVGEVQANESVSLSFPAGGKVERVLVREGDAVRAGQRLATVNRSTAQNAYNSAKAQLEQAEDACRRLKKVYEQGSLAEVKWVEMLTALERARSMEQIAFKQLEDCALTAPCAGVIGECHAKAGGSLMPGEPVLTILDVQRVAVSFSVPESEIATVSEGSDVEIVIPALDNRSAFGKITERSMSASRISHSYDVKVSLPNADKSLLPGMVCKVNLRQPDSQGIIVPAKCVQTRPNGQSVWVVRNGNAHLRMVRASEFVANGVLVTSGLQSGDTVVVAGMQKLYENAPVSILK